MIAGTLFSVFPILIFIAFFIILIKTIIDSKNNSKLPRLTVEAIVISKKEDYDPPSTDANGFSTGGSSTYYATFQVESGDLIKFRISHSEYSALFKGDTGRLSLQGSRFLGFEQCKIDTTRFRYSNTYQ